ncbi:MAG: DUF1177 family protein [Xanthobacteraceae bacterium]
MLKEVIDVLDLMTMPDAGIDEFLALMPNVKMDVRREVVSNEKGSTEFLKILIPGTRGKSSGGDTRTLGVIGSLGALRFAGENRGLVSDADGCVAALAVALRFARMAEKGQRITADVMISTQVCQRGYEAPHDPYPFVMTPLPSSQKHPRLVDPVMDAVLAVETCKSNKLLNHRGFAITHVAKEGLLLRVHADLIHIMEMVTGRLPVIFPVSQQDLTPYESGIHHVCGMMLGNLYTDAPVVGVPITTESQTWPAWTNVAQPDVLEQAGRFCIEVATRFGNGQTQIFYQDDYVGMKKYFGDPRKKQ